MKSSAASVVVRRELNWRPAKRLCLRWRLQTRLRVGVRELKRRNAEQREEAQPPMQQKIIGTMFASPPTL